MSDLLVLAVAVLTFAACMKVIWVVFYGPGEGAEVEDQPVEDVGITAANDTWLDFDNRMYEEDRG